MSLDVSPALLQQAEHGQVDERDFVETIRASLPYAWETISNLVADLEVAGPGTQFADNQTPPPSEQHRGQLLRTLASDSIRGALERHFGVKLAFQNCHRVAAFRPQDTDGSTYQEFVTPRAQILNQSPELRDC